jgi:hypothetical protein
LSTLFNLPLTNYFLSETQIKSMFKHKIWLTFPDIKSCCVDATAFKSYS